MSMASAGRQVQPGSNCGTPHRGIIVIERN
ncbi:hypothetical protein NPIL_306101, partial [Nephila pilipes]